MSRIERAIGGAFRQVGAYFKVRLANHTIRQILSQIQGNPEQDAP